MMTDLAQLNSIKVICGRVFVYYNTLKSQYIYIYIYENINKCPKGISLRIFFRNILFFLDSLEIFYEKIIKQLIFLTVFYNFHESDV